MWKGKAILKMHKEYSVSNILELFNRTGVLLKPERFEWTINKIGYKETKVKILLEKLEKNDIINNNSKLPRPIQGRSKGF